MLKLTRKLRSRLPAAVAILLVASPAAAADENTPPRYWLLDQLSPAELDRHDWLMLRQNVLLALYELEDGQSVGWVHPDTDHSGAVRVLASSEFAGVLNCRRIQVSIDIGHQGDSGIYQLCQDHRGFWVFVSVPARAHPLGSDAGR